MGIWIFTISIIILVIITSMFVIVPQESADVVERLGKFQNVWQAGVTMLRNADPNDDVIDAVKDDKQ